MAACISGLAQSEVVNVGILHSLSGTMSISEKSVANATLLALEEVNLSGGVLGRQVVIHQQDGASRPEIFVQKAQMLLSNKKSQCYFWWLDQRQPQSAFARNREKPKFTVLSCAV